jgi:hypothetical protein
MCTVEASPSARGRLDFRVLMRGSGSRERTCLIALGPAQAEIVNAIQIRINQRRTDLMVLPVLR